MAYGQAIGGDVKTNGQVVEFPRINSTADTLSYANPYDAPVGTLTQAMISEHSGNLIVFHSNTVYLMRGFTNVVLSSFTPKDEDEVALTYPTADDYPSFAGVAYVPEREEILVGRNGVVYVYNKRGVYKRHFDTGISSTSRITYDPVGKNLITVDWDEREIRIMNGLSGTESSSFYYASLSSCSAVTIDDAGNLIATGGSIGNTIIYVQDGISATNTSSFSVPGAGHTEGNGEVYCLGLAYDHLNQNLISATTPLNFGTPGSSTHSINVHTGKTITVSTTHNPFVEDTGIIRGICNYRLDTIPEGWVKATGQTLDDPESPWHNKTLPNLSGATKVDSDAEWIMRIK